MDDQTVVEVTATTYNSLIIGGLILPALAVVLLTGLLMVWATSSVTKS